MEWTTGFEPAGYLLGRKASGQLLNVHMELLTGVEPAMPEGA